MKNSNKIKALRIILSLLYIFSIAPSFVFHNHHNHTSISIEDADSCEKAIYFGIKDEHSEHISEYQSECWLCKTHIVSPQIVFENNFNTEFTEFRVLNFVAIENYTFVFFKSKFNKGPPDFIS